MTRTASRAGEADKPGPKRPTSAEHQPSDAAGTPEQRARREEDEGLAEARITTLRDSFWRWGRVMFVLVALFVGVQLLLMLGGIVAAVLRVILYVVFGGIVALIVEPLTRLLRRAIPRPLAALLSLLALLGVVFLLGLVLGQSILSEVKSLSSSLPRLEQPFQQLQQWLVQHGFNVSIGSVAGSLGLHLSSSSEGSLLVSALSVTVQLVVDTVVVLVTAFWLLDDHEALRDGLLNILPTRMRLETDFVLKAFVAVFGGYLRGQLVLAVLVGTLAGLGCWLLGVPYPLIIAVAAGAFELIPLAGPFVGAAVAVLFAYTQSSQLALEVIGLFILIHVIEGYVVSPRIQGRFVRLHPLVTLLALLVGAESSGFLGAFFAVPVASLLAVIVRAGVRELRTTQPELFMSGAHEAALRGQRRALLDEYSLNPGVVVRRLVRRWRGRTQEQ
jgi:predicted PurR-regulated permease PerM